MQRFSPGRLAVALLFLAAALDVSAQGTAISYQGRLSDSGSFANTNYDFRFIVYTAVTNGSPVSSSVTNFNVPVSNGLFSVAIDFGPNVFNGTSNGSNDWLDVSVRPAGTNAFTVLYPRQPIYPVPYALFAVNASNLLGSLQATQLVGKITSGLLTGTYTNGVNFSNPTNTFTGSFTGNGGGLTNLNASQIVSGTLADARLTPNVALLNATQIFTGSNSFTGNNGFSGNGTYTGVNTFNNANNSFTGNFFGNGHIGWLSLAANSTNPAPRNTGLVALNSGITTITLPASGTLTANDVVRVSGGGSGGWKVQLAPGQTVTGPFYSYANGFLFTSSGDNRGVAASADGARVYTVGNFVGVAISSDFGRNIFTTVSGVYFSGQCVSVACSANGKTVYAEPASGHIMKSTDYGFSWVDTLITGNGAPISCTADGVTLIQDGVNCSGDGTYRVRFVSGQISYSTNSGSGWINISGPAANVGCVACSSDCTRLVAGVTNGNLYVSSNLGASWTAVTATNQYWCGAWMSADGSKFAAAARVVSGTPGGVDSMYVVPVPMSTSSGGSLVGSQGSAVELLYTGANNKFVPASFSGALWAN